MTNDGKIIENSHTIFCFDFKLDKLYRVYNAGFHKLRLIHCEFITNKSNNVKKIIIKAVSGLEK